MTYRAKIINGQVVFQGTERPAEGTEVQVVSLPTHPSQPVVDSNGKSLSNILLEFAGTVPGLPEDASLNVDHYVYGTPKR